MLKSVCLAIGLCSSISGPAITVDGDTVKVAGVAVRLLGLDCEELSEAHGPAAREAMRAFTYGVTVTCDLTGAPSYNRKVGVCYANGLDLARLMVATGYCLDCAHYDGGKYAKDEPQGSRSTLIQKPYCVESERKRLHLTK